MGGLAACAPIVDEVDTTTDLQAPDSISDVLEALWLGYPEATDATMGVAQEALFDLVDVDGLLDGHEEGGQRRFEAPHLEVVDLFAPPDDDGTWSLPDPQAARPLFIVTRFTCSLPALEAVLVARNQHEQYEGAYLTYDRRYTSDASSFTSGSSDTLTWEVDLRSTYPLAGEFTEYLLGGIRRLDLPTDTAWAGPEALLTRTWLPYPAARDNDGIDFRQDYQLELYLPYGDDEIVHLYGMWRQLSTPFGDFEGSIARLTLTNLVGWDDRTEELCAQTSE